MNIELHGSAPAWPIVSKEGKPPVRAEATQDQFGYRRAFRQPKASRREHFHMWKEGEKWKPLYRKRFMDVGPFTTQKEFAFPVAKAHRFKTNDYIWINEKGEKVGNL